MKKSRCSCKSRTRILMSRTSRLRAAPPSSLTFRGVNAAGWMRLGGENWELAELDGYETPIKDGQLHDIISGDLNQDGRKDLVFLETAKNYLDLVIFDKHDKLIPATRWQVFEEPPFRNRRSDQPEPREALIVDVTGDGKNDLVVVVHDRILVYPQEKQASGRDDDQTQGISGVSPIEKRSFQPCNRA